MPGLTEDSIKTFIANYVDSEHGVTEDPDKLDALLALLKQDSLFIRPSGNPLDIAGYKAMVSSKDVTGYTSKLVSIDSVSVIADGKVGIATYTVDQCFNYKGTKNEDRAKISLIIEDVDGTPKVAHGHRCTGQPIPKE